MNIVSSYPTTLVVYSVVAESTLHWCVLKEKNVWSSLAKRWGRILNIQRMGANGESQTAALALFHHSISLHDTCT